MYAVIKTGGKQYKVQVGQRLKIETIEADQGAKVNFDERRIILPAVTIWPPNFFTPNRFDSEFFIPLVLYQHACWTTDGLLNSHLINNPLKSNDDR